MKKTTPQLLLVDQFNRFIKCSASGRRSTPSGKRISKGTIMNYFYALQLLIEYEQKNNLQLRIQLLHRTSLRALQREKNYWARFFIQFSNFLFKEKGYHDNYVLNVFKILKTFFNYLEKEKGLIVGNYHKSFRVPVLQATAVVLTPDQLQFLINNKEFFQSLSSPLKRARDIFVFGCTVALRISDLMMLKKTNLIQNNGESFLTLFTQKTGSEIRVPLPDHALEIISRNWRKAGKYILPRLSPVNLNVQIKKLIKQAGWDYAIPKYISYKGRMKERKTGSGNTWPFYQHITAHTMRRTAITTLLILGVPETIVRKISGHAPGSKEFYKYVSIAQEYLNHEVKKAYQKLVGFPSAA